MPDKARRAKRAKPNPLGKAVIRTGAVRSPDLGYLLAADLGREKRSIPHARFFKWQAGTFNEGSLNFNAHAAVDAKVPQPVLVVMSGQGNFGLALPGTSQFGNIFNDSQPRPTQTRYGEIRSLAEIDGKAYAVGLDGMVYRLDQIPVWTRIDDGLPTKFDIEGIHGFNASDLYAVGARGEVWHFDGKTWSRRDMPTNVTLTSVRCTPGGKVFIAGKNGMLIHGAGDAWEVIDHQTTDADFWDLEWFEGKLYASTMGSVYRLDGTTLVKVDFGSDTPKTSYHLSAAEGVLWSIGEKDVMSFDGKKWTRIV